MPLDKRYYIHTGYDGALDAGDTTAPTSPPW